MGEVESRGMGRGREEKGMEGKRRGELGPVKNA